MTAAVLALVLVLVRAADAWRVARDLARAPSAHCAGGTSGGVLAT